VNRAAAAVRRAPLLVLLVGTAAAQGASVHAAFAADPRAEGPPGLVWLRQELLARRPEWPAGRQALDAFALHVDGRGLRIGEALPLPRGAAAAGELAIDGASATFATASFATGVDGHDELYLRGAAVPPALAPLLAALHVDVDGAPRLVDLTALLGNLTGPVLEGDGVRALLPLLAARCGEATFAVARDGDGLRVRGGSDGGLALPLALLWLAAADQSAPALRGPAMALCLRAFGGRDGDRAEAVRQLQRAGADGLPGLRALLHADEECRLAAIDGLVRMRAVAELPRIVAAAQRGLPLATAMAATAVRELWADAPADVRAAVRSALARSDALDASAIPANAAPAAPDPRWRLLAELGLVAIGLLGLWQRERAGARAVFARA
jgi:hypothetical protein